MNRTRKVVTHPGRVTSNDVSEVWDEYEVPIGWGCYIGAGLLIVFAIAFVIVIALLVCKV